MDVLLTEHLLAAGANISTATGRVNDFGNVPAEYAALTGEAGLVDFSDRTQIEVTGADRQSFLHNLCTNEVRKLTAGAGSEAFLCNPQGHVLALVTLFCGQESLVLETVPQQEAALLAQLDKYLIREKVELHARSQEWAELYLAGAAAEALLLKLTSAAPERLYSHLPARIGDVDVWLRRVDITLPVGFLIACPRANVSGIWQALVRAGAKPCGSAAVEMARLEAGTPYFGRDITNANLPQELARDSRAISFVKGCYIGQETVARLDALGHVNRTMCGVRFAGQQIPDTGLELTNDAGKSVGQVTSASFSPRLGAPLALAFVRRETNSPGCKLSSPLGSCEVIALPLQAG